MNQGAGQNTADWTEIWAVGATVARPHPSLLPQEKVTRL